MTTIRVEKRHRYTSIDRAALNDRRLSYRARGILAYLLDKPDDWKTNADSIAAAGNEGREAVRTALKELESVGYLKRRKWRGEKGQWESEWTVLERPEGTEPRRDSGAGQNGAEAAEPGRETGAGCPPRIPGPQLLNTETEPVLSEEVFSSADPNCIQCRGLGRFTSGAGFSRVCPCCDDRPLVEIEES